MRKWLKILSILALLLVAIAITCIWQVNRLLDAASIKNLHYQIDNIGLGSASFSVVSFSYAHESYPQALELRGAQLKWEWRGFIPHLRNVNIEKFIIKDSPSHRRPAQPQEITAPYHLPDDWHLPDYIPDKINIRHFLWQKDCASERCNISAQVDIAAQHREQFIINVEVNPGDLLDVSHQVTLNANYSIENNLPKLNVKLSSNTGDNLQLSTQLHKTTEMFWVGILTGVVSDPDEAWLQQLGLAKNKSIQSFDESGLNLNGKWSLAVTPLLQIPPAADISQYTKALSGNMFLELNMEQGLHIPSIGKVAGKVLIDAETLQGAIKRYSLLADLNADSLNFPVSWNLGIPSITKVRFNAKASQNNNVSLSNLPIEISIDADGDLSGGISGTFIIDIFSKKIITDGMTINATLGELKLDEYEFKNASINVKGIGYWQPESFSFNVNQPSHITSDLTFKNLGLIAKSASIKTKSLIISGKTLNGSLVLSDVVIESDGSVAIKKLAYDQLKDNSWNWQGKMHGKLDDLLVVGELKIGSSLSLKHEMVLKSSMLNAKWSLVDIYLLAANPFADTLKAWPPLLSLARGKLNGNGAFEYNLKDKVLAKSESILELQDLAGIYDTTAFEGVTTKLNISTKNKTIKLESNNLQVNQINKGFVFGPLHLKAIYEALWEKPMQGNLALMTLTGQVAQGTVSTPAQNFDLGRSTQHVLVDLKQINLTSLLQQYPTSELSGSGLISGRIPLEISKKGIRVSKGAIAAEEPGGKLKYTSAKASELAKSQPSMKLLTEALSDFQYSVLSSDVNYDESGKLILSVRLEGKNPSFENGRPIHFNINFEEDIPAMLASIQLSSRVNDIIKKRVQEYLQKRPHTGDVTIKK